MTTTPITTTGNPYVADPKPAPIYLLMGRVLADISAVPKDQTNEHFSYKFRSIDQVMNAMHRAMSKHGVFYVPQVLSREYATLGKQRHALVEVVYKFHGPAGDWVEYGPYIGEGMDSSDKATAKALTAALKYLLLHGFCIPTEDSVDADASDTSGEWSAGSASGTPTEDNGTKAGDRGLPGPPQGSSSVADRAAAQEQRELEARDEQVRYAETLFKTYGAAKSLRTADEVARERGVGKVRNKRELAALSMDVLDDISGRLAQSDWGDESSEHSG